MALKTQAQKAAEAAAKAAAGAPAIGGAAPEAPAAPLYALVNLGPGGVKMAARRILPKQKFRVPPFAVLLLPLEDRDRYLAPSRNPLGGTNPLHVWSRLRHAELGLKVGDGKGDDAPVDPEAFGRVFKRALPQAWCPAWLPQGIPTVTRKQALEWMKNYGVGMQRWIESYLAILENAAPDGVPEAECPNLAVPYVRELDAVSKWAAKRLGWLDKEEKRGVGIKEQRPPFGPGAKMITRGNRVAAAPR